MCIPLTERSKHTVEPSFRKLFHTNNLRDEIATIRPQSAQGQGLIQVLTNSLSHNKEQYKESTKSKV